MQGVFPILFTLVRHLRHQCLPSVDSVNMYAYVWLSESWYDFIVRFWLQPEVTHGWSDLIYWFSIISLKRWFGGLWSCHMEPHLEPSICTVHISAWGNLRGLFRCCTQTSLSAADKRHWTRSHYLDLCQCFGEELDAICQPLPRLNIFGTQLRVQQTTENRKIYGYLCSELFLYI